MGIIGVARRGVAHADLARLMINKDHGQDNAEDNDEGTSSASGDIAAVVRESEQNVIAARVGTRKERRMSSY